MKTVSFHGGRAGKLESVAAAFGDYLGDVLDLGCDAGHLAKYTESYVGVDVAGCPDVRVDLEQPFCFAPGSFETVVAMDVLEHLDRMHAAFDEACRCSDRYVVVGLPNMYGLLFRARFLAGQKLNGKYGLPLDPPPDRHRWLFGLDEARLFVAERGRRNGFAVIDEALVYCDYRRLVPRLVNRLARRLAPLGVGLFAWAWWGVLERKHDSNLDYRGAVDR